MKLLIQNIIHKNIIIFVYGIFFIFLSLKSMQEHNECNMERSILDKLQKQKLYLEMHYKTFVNFQFENKILGPLSEEEKRIFYAENPLKNDTIITKID